MSTTSVTPFLTGGNLNFLALVAYNPCLFYSFFGQFFHTFQDQGIAMRTRIFMDFAKKVG